MMNEKDINEKIKDLIHLDIDAVQAYDQALKNIDNSAIHSQLTDFRGDHERHIRVLSEELRQRGGSPPEFKKDIKGFFIEGFTAIRSMTGTEGALKAMRSNEKLTNATYSKCLSLDLPEDLRSVIERNYDDEQRHLNYIEQCLASRPWESTAHA